jgi:hypothetical protein
MGWIAEKLVTVEWLGGESNTARAGCGFSLGPAFAQVIVVLTQQGRCSHCQRAFAVKRHRGANGLENARYR